MLPGPSAEVLWQTVMDNAPVAVWLIDKDGRFVMLGGAAAGRLPHASETIGGASIFDVYRDDPQIVGAARRVLAGESFDMTLEGEGRIWQGHYSPIMDSGGRVAYGLGMVIDITDRVAAEREARDANERMAVAFRCSQEDLWEWDLATGYVKSSNPMIPSPPEVGNRRDRTFAAFIESLHPQDVPRVKAALDAHFRGEAPYEVEYRALRRDGTYRWTRSRGQVVRDAEGKPVRMLGSMADIHDRREAEQRLSESESKYRLLVEATGTGYVVLDESGRVLDANSEYVRLTGRQSVEHVVGRSVLEWTAPHDLERKECEIRRTMEVGGVSGLEIDYRWPDGTIVPIEINGRMVDTPTGRQIIALCRDITARKRGEMERFELGQRFSLLSRRSPLAFVTLSPDAIFTEWNPAAEKIFGYTRAEAIGRPLSIILPDENRPDVYGVFGQIVSKRGGERKRNLNRTKDGRTIVCEWYNTPLVDDHGRVVGVASLGQDVTEQVRATEQLAERERDLRMITDAMPALISYVGRDLRYQFTNKTYERWLNIDQQSLRGMSVSDALGPDQFEAIRGFIDNALGGELTRFEQTIRLADNSVRELDVTLVPRRTHAGVEGYYVLAIDVTQRKTAERKLAVYRDHLESLVEKRTFELETQGKRLRETERLASLGTLAAGLGHDINNLLLPMRCLVDTLEPGGGAGPDVFAQNLASLRQSLSFLGKLSRSLLDLAGAAAPDDSGSRNRLELSAWWHEAETVLRSAVGADHTLTVMIPAGMPEVTIAAAQLTRVVLNLLINAAEASPTAARIHIGARTNPPGPETRATVEVFVTDNGPGMSEQTLQRAMEPFFTTKTRGVSTGLGLALVNAVVSGIGGTVRLESKPGAGTTVTLVLPVVQPSPNAASRHAFVSVTDERNEALLKTFLSAQGYSVATSPPPTRHSGAAVWLVEPKNEFIARARDFVSPDGGRVVILLGGADARWDGIGALPVLNPNDLHLIASTLRELGRNLGTGPRSGQ